MNVYKLGEAYGPFGPVTRFPSGKPGVARPPVKTPPKVGSPFGPPTRGLAIREAKQTQAPSPSHLGSFVNTYA